MKKVTSNDVAKLAGVSQATVSMILNNKPGLSFSDNTKNKVLEAAHQLGYKTPALSNLDTERKLIAVFIPTLSNPYYTQLTAAIEKYALIQGYKITLCNTSRNKEYENYYLNYFSHSKVAGIIFTFVPSYPKLVEQLALSIPIVLIGEKTDDLNIPSIELNNEKAGIIMGEYLLSLGHKHIAFFTTPIQNFSRAREQRMNGLKQAMNKHHLGHNLDIEISDHLTESDQNNIPYEYTVGCSLIKDYIKANKKATAFIGVNDMTALGIIFGLHALGYNCPKDYSVAGFDNIFVSSVSIPSITSIEHHLGLRSQAAVDMIIEKQNDLLSDIPSHLSAQISRTVYEPQLIIRDSTAFLK